MFLTIFTTKKAWFFGKLIQASHGKSGQMLTGSAGEFHFSKPEYAEFIDLETIIGQFKATIFQLFKSMNKPWVKPEEFFYCTWSVGLDSTTRTLYFLMKNNICKYFWLKAEVFAALSAYKDGFFGKHIFNIK